MAYWLINDPSVITVFDKIRVSLEILYVISVTLPKLATTAMFLKVFVNKGVRRATWLNGLLIFLNGLWGLIASFAICRPLAFYWDHKIKGRCGNVVAAWIFFSVPNIISDIITLILPISTLYKLQVPLWKKIGLFITFLVGGL